MKKVFTLIFIFLCIQLIRAQPAQVLAGSSGISRLIENSNLAKKDSVANWSLHAQITTVYQYHPAFNAAYSGIKSLNSEAEGALSVTHTLFLGRKLWRGGAFYFNPEITGGNGLSKTVGLAGFPNGEIYRVGNPTPTPFVARAFYQQIIPIGKYGFDFLASDMNQLEGKIPASRLVISVGKFCVSDFFDENNYNHDARSQFLNWSLMANGAWDFPADVRGYTSGLVVELIKPMWAVRIATVSVPVIANGMLMEYDIARAHSETIEYERKWIVKNRPGIIRATAYMTHSRAPLYKDAVNALAKGDSSFISVISGNEEGNKINGVKYGGGINIEQEVATGVGVFSRLNWNDGQSATWAFTEIDNSLQLGATVKGYSWKRPTDQFGIAVVMNGISQDHRTYLKAGGNGFMLGDGTLNYGSENILETFYRIQVSKGFWATVDYQFINNPAYNKDRGPVSIFGLRTHLEF